MAEMHRPALGQEVAIGTLYDAKRDQFLPASILPHSAPEGIISRLPCEISQQHNIVSSVGATHKDRFNLMDIDSNLAASVTCDLIVPQGSGMFLKDGTSGKNILQGNVRHIYNTCREYVELSNPDVSHVLAQGLVGVADVRSTHFVVAVNYGLQSIITMKYELKDPQDKTNVDPIFSRDVRTVHDIATSLPSLDFSDNTVNRRLALEYEFRLYTDIQKEYGICMESLALLCTFVQTGPKQIRAASGQKGYPIIYTLLPLQFLNRLGTTTIPDSIRTHVPITDIDPVLNIFDRFNECKERLDDYKLIIQARKHYIPLEHLDDVNNAILRISGAQNNVKVELKRRVLDFRNGIKDAHHFHTLCTTVETDPPERISSLAGQQNDRIDFITDAVNHGATYIGFNGLSLKDVTLPHDSPTPYTFEFNSAVLKGSSLWKQQHHAFMEFLLNPQRRCQVYIVDCDAPLQLKHLDCARFSEMQRNTVSAQHEDHDYSSSERKEPKSRPARQRRSRKCVARYSRDALDVSTTHGFTEQRLVRMPCPGKSCDCQRDCKWTCTECDSFIEFCSGDDYIYCDCGRALCENWRFRCDGESHGRDFDRPSSRLLDKFLKRSSRTLYRNILVLGETGVGKSTFINAFYNFLKFSSFDEAKAESRRKLEYVIPCRFSITVPSLTDSLNYETQVIRVGSRDDERDGTGGDSATQKTSVYTMKYGNTAYRLFDTPGIGDTRGPEQDKENLRGIMARLRDYEELHGILILLKTNETRMTATFQFCFEELLSTIQRDAVPNIVFGFTHTMDSSYRPGGCLPILKRKLEDHANVDFVLSSQTAYSFDAESFRYLASLYRGIKRDDERTCHESWDKSRAEVLRFLEHIDGLKPHDVGQTISMDGVRQAIDQLMVPMVKVSQTMKDNIERLDRDVKELQDKRLTGDKLRKKLHLQRTELRADKLDKPRTVCKNRKCCDLKTNPNGEVVADYKWVCHNDCKLPNVTEDSVGHPGLASCRAFKKDKMTCSNEHCGHHWQEHVHILYELKEHKVQVKDTEVERRLKANTNDITIRQDGIRKIKELQKEYEDERDQLRTAMVRFVAYLKKHAITAVNDRTENYYIELINIEENKIQRAKDKRMNVEVNVKKLQGLKQDLDAHLELTETIKQNMRAPRDSSDKLLTREGVKKLIQDLYNLPHFGKNLENMKTVIVSSHETGSHRRERSRGRRGDVEMEVGDGDGDEAGPSNTRRERDSSARRESNREGRPWLFWRS
ncbi:hypothetical protein FPOA_06434 [Fusarium poae]|uniref:G domain-containing protein n=1 Tax=Fusarium poae TaxID=36050 RepID=A0A1B8AZH2_FUSPO|nr:hypothetical protein FPOA_06434 [Fusarium poae]